MERNTANMILRAKQAYASLLCEKQTLELGIAYWNASFAALSEVNQYREVIASSAAEAKNALCEASNWFDERGLTCRRLAPAEGRASDELRDLVEAQGFVRRQSTVMALTQWVTPTQTDDLRVVPARAVRTAYRTATANSIDTSDARYRTQVADAAMERLDSPQLDAFLVIGQGQPVGVGGLFQVGDVAQVVGLNVIVGAEVSAVRSALLAKILSFAKRLEMRNVCFELAHEADDELRVVLESWGFESSGLIEEFELFQPESASSMS